MNTVVESFIIQERQDSRDWKRYTSSPRVYCSLQFGEFNAVDDVLYRRLHKSLAIKPLVVEELKKAGIIDAKLRWSQKAGCACGCSPGFIITSFGRLNSGNPSNGFKGTRFDAWMTYTVK